MSAWRLREVSVEEDEWRRLLSRTPHLIFHQPAWARVIAAGMGGETRCLVIENDGEILGGMLGFARRFLWTRLLFFNIPYGGVIGQAPPGEDLARLLGELARREGASRIRIVNAPGLSPSPLDGFKQLPNKTYVLDIGGRSYEQIFGSFSKNIRRDVRRAERSGLSVDAALDHEAVDQFYSLYLESMRRNRAVPKYNRKLVGAICEQLVRAGPGALLLARRDQRVVAGILVVDSPNASHYLLGGSRTDALAFCPNDLLLARAIQRASARRLQFFDFLPSAPGDTGLIRFKTKWGAVPVPADTLDLIARPLTVKLFNAFYGLAETRPFRLLLHQVQKRR